MLLLSVAIDLQFFDEFSHINMLVTTPSYLTKPTQHYLLVEYCLPTKRYHGTGPNNKMMFLIKSSKQLLLPLFLCTLIPANTPIGSRDASSQGIGFVLTTTHISKRSYWRKFLVWKITPSMFMAEKSSFTHITSPCFSSQENN